MTTPKLTDEMVEAFEREGAGGYGDITDTRAGLAAVLAIVARDHEVVPYCNAELIPGIACKLGARQGHRKHKGTTSTGTSVEWEALP